MSEEAIFVDPSYLTCEINGSQFVFQTSSNTPNTFIDVGSLFDSKELDDNYAFKSINHQNNQTIENNHNNPTIHKQEDDSIPIVCLDGIIYALQNGQLQQLDLSRLQSNVNNDPEQQQIQETKETITVVEDSFVAKPEPITPIDQFSLDHSIQNVHINVELSDKYALTAEKLNNENNFIVEHESNTLNSTLNANDFLEVVAAFKCKICPYTTQDRGELLTHFQNIHANPPQPIINNNNNSKYNNDESPTKTEDVKLVYMCGECSSCFPSMENCREHMINDHQLMDRTRDRIDDDNLSHDITTTIKKTINKAAEKKSDIKMKRDMKLVTNKNGEYSRKHNDNIAHERNVKCTHRGCLYKFRSEDLMQKHVTCHVESEHANIFKCNYCTDMKFTKWRACSVHLWKKHKVDIDLLSCNICKIYKSFTSVKLLAHMRVHSESKDFECPECGKRFKQSSQLRNHRVMHLDRKTADVPRWYTSKTCEMCGKTYADSKCLKNHMQAVHSKLRPYVCNVCGHSSARKAMLQMHLRQHTGDKPFNCDMCDFKTGDHNSLRRHIMRHTGVRPYKCPHCPYSAIQSNSYKNHLKAKHPTSSGLFICEMCPFNTVKKETYVEHIGDHERGLIKTPVQKNDDNVEVFPGNMAAAQLIYSCLGSFSKVGNTIEASLMSSSTSADGTSQTITIQIPSTHLEGSLPVADNNGINKNNTNSMIDQEDDETMHCFLKIPHEEEENIDTGGITIPAEPEDAQPTILNVES